LLKVNKSLEFASITQLQKQAFKNIVKTDVKWIYLPWLLLFRVKNLI